MEGEEVCCLHALVGISHSYRTITPFAPKMLSMREVFFEQCTSAKDGPVPWDQHFHARLCRHSHGQ